MGHAENQENLLKGEALCCIGAPGGSDQLEPMGAFPHGQLGGVCGRRNHRDSGSGGPPSTGVMISGRRRPVPITGTPTAMPSIHTARVPQLTE